ncbi:glycine cleavage system aminomethyltransferase GcvT [Steroidobacter sp.]|uniref:glycine cleavage system aminomethyltransferase GcvT n=1 Tax=Steroidobacter sp. TaxID=1978227 RepID=UPI001A459466|nr:glycine cleavage system aminomethyltransferase GcvT [Steroidobacter sp.]MBL8267804.1 glycine cleavage system aminomethyltransferase GcvT [Steroidobacter sp.]
MGFKTPLYDTHVAAGARLVDFGGWDMPVNYGSQIEEHHAVRRDAGMFDVSHMLIADVTGARARDYLRYLLANDVAKLKEPGKALYSCMLNERGGVVDDLIVYFLTDTWFRVVVNAGTRDKDIAWLKRFSDEFKVDINPRTDLAMIAVQGPNARAKAATLIGKYADEALQLKTFVGREFGQYFIARTGYTGEDGWEVMLPVAEVAKFWTDLKAAGVAECGLGARDTLRLEAGMNLYGNDMDENLSPLESGLTWTVAFDPLDRDFVGRAALDAERAGGVKRKLVGLILDERGVLRGHQRVATSAGDGELTSGTFSPTMEKSIGFARVPAATGDRVEVDIRGKLLPARVVKYPFVRNGKPLIS